MYDYYKQGEFGQYKNVWLMLKTAERLSSLPKVTVESTRAQAGGKLFPFAPWWPDSPVFGVRTSPIYRSRSYKLDVLSHTK